MPISEKRLAEIKAIKDDEIDTSDIPEMGEDFFRNATFRRPDMTKRPTTSPELSKALDLLMNMKEDRPLTCEERQGALDTIIRPVNMDGVHSCDFTLRGANGLAGIEDMYQGKIEWNPDFQRGHVWTEVQQIAFIEAMLRGTLARTLLTIQFNCPSFADHFRGPGVESDLDPVTAQCIDGLQRVTAIKRWVAGEIKPFGLKLGDLEGTSYDIRRIGYRLTVVTHAFTTRRELLDYYIAINSGGTVHSDEEIGRVRALRDAS